MQVDLIGSALATWLVMVAGRLGAKGQGWIFGPDVERCLQRVSDSAIESVVRDAAPYLDDSLRDHVVDLLRRSLSQPAVVQRLVGPVMAGDADASPQWREYVGEQLALIDWPTVPDVRLARVVAGLPEALRASLAEEGSRPGSPIFPMLVVLGLQELQHGLRAIREDDAHSARSSWSDRVSAPDDHRRRSAAAYPPPAAARHNWLVEWHASTTAMATRAYRDPTTGVEFVGVPGGVFEMGSGELTRHERPPHWVSLTSFWMARTPVTNQQYRAFLAQTGHAFPLSFTRPEFSGGDQPVVGVSWDDARAFCGWLSTVSGRPVSLPTEAQWEYAARGPECLPFPWGEDPPTPSITHYGGTVETGHTVSVYEYEAAVGPFGHLQQLGNVWEWCLDEWATGVYATRTEAVPVNPGVPGDGAHRVVRGAGWQCTQERVHSAHRCRNNRNFRGWATGFRVMIGESHGLSV